MAAPNNHSTATPSPASARRPAAGSASLSPSQRPRAASTSASKTQRKQQQTQQTPSKPQRSQSQGLNPQSAGKARSQLTAKLAAETQPDSRTRPPKNNKTTNGSAAPISGSQQPNVPGQATNAKASAASSAASQGARNGQRSQSQPLPNNSTKTTSPKYAGATFQNSPAPSALPMPVFSNSLMPSVAAAAGLPPAGDKHTNSEPPSLASTPQPLSQMRPQSAEAQNRLQSMSAFAAPCVSSANTTPSPQQHLNVQQHHFVQHGSQSGSPQAHWFSNPSQTHSAHQMHLSPMPHAPWPVWQQMPQPHNSFQHYPPPLPMAMQASIAAGPSVSPNHAPGHLSSSWTAGSAIDWIRHKPPDGSLPHSAGPPNQPPQQNNAVVSDADEDLRIKSRNLLAVLSAARDDAAPHAPAKVCPPSEPQELADMSLSLKHMLGLRLE